MDVSSQFKLSWEEAVRWLIAQPEQAELARAAYFDLPTSAAARRYRDSAEWAQVRRLLPEEKGRALDLGAGNGIMSYALAADGWTTTAVEPDPSDLVGAGAIRTLAAETGVAIEVIEAFGEAIPLDSADFDLVIARQVLHHAADLGQFCREMARLVRRGGMVVTLRDHVVDGPESHAEFLKIHPLHHLYGGENAFQRQEYLDAMRAAGLDVVREIGSFDSVINYAPLTPDSIVGEIGKRVPGPRGVQSAASAMLGLMPFPVLARLLSRIDRRPGRLVSIKAIKR